MKQNGYDGNLGVTLPTYELMTVLPQSRYNNPAAGMTKMLGMRYVIYRIKL